MAFASVRGWIGGLALVMLPLEAPAKEVRSYIFGNSLIHHDTDTDETTVPHWIGVLAQTAGHDYRVDGHWGFLRNFAADLPPPANWTYSGTPRAWTRSYRTFGQVGYDTIMINPANFIQNRAADRPYDGEKPDGASPLSATLSLFDWVAAESENVPRFVIYEGWSDLGAFSQRFPPNARALRRYYTFNVGEYHDWYVEYRDRIRAARPGYRVTLLPVARTLAGFLGQGGMLENLPPEALYTDNAPHGTPTLYFLAALISYAGLFDEAPPAELTLPDTIHAKVRDNYAALRQVIADVYSISDSARATTVPAATETARKNNAASHDEAAEPALGLRNPPLAMGLNGITDWSVQHPFLDRMKSARTWIGHLPGRWGGVSTQELSEGGHLDENGWLRSIPERVDRVEALILTDQLPEEPGLAGRYRMTYEGTGDIAVGGRGRTISREDGEHWFEYQPGEGAVAVAIRTTDPEGTGDYIRNIRILHEDQIPLFEAGAEFNPRWIEKIADLRSLRFMDWMQTNGSSVKGWEDRPTTADYTYKRRGVPVEVMVRLANLVGADPWFCMPHLADDDFVRRFADYVRDSLDPKLKTYVEYSNELWNFIFPQAQWANTQAAERWGEGAAPDAWVQYAGMRAARTMRLWSDVYGEAAEERLIRVLGVHSGWPGLESGMLDAPLWQAEAPGNGAPAEAFDAYAVTGYFGRELGGDDHAPQILDWLSEEEGALRDAGRAEGLEHRVLDLYVEERRFASVVPKVAKLLREGSVRELILSSWPYHARTARARGLQLVMYEGGTHVLGHGAWGDSATLSEFFQHLNYTDEMAAIYAELLKGWREAGGTLFNAFVDVARPSKFGSWGALRHLGDENPRHGVLMAYNRETSAWWETRAPDTFTHGALMHGTDGPDRIVGTPKRDIILAGPGDDELYASGPDDLLHGGEGMDHAILSGRFEDYDYRRADRRLIAVSPKARVSMFAIETFSFSEEPDFVLSVADFF
ncbi:hypothetical protein SAMN04490248_1014 [Salinihabitans flavidus]|uniref:Type I secretion C-terminal target domain (VC_A0849 subclass) n=1 Tax=Salinihabitans flavidus TaxID=569882 RepID=A0A1H8L7M6_9RHOB|nr:hypothetical protein [Salinihabitans flavidus]SEO00708.1 hypothetical protein SAMN04490248_1014 [Salinihabitans flavidus]